MTFDEFLAEWNNSDNRIRVQTSGSTGVPKVMWVEKRRMLASARITCDFLGLTAGDKALLCMPLDYIAGKMMVVRALERDLHLVQVKPSNHPLASLTDEDIRFAAMVPSQVFCTLQVEEERARLACVRDIIIGGGAITRELQNAINAFCQEHHGCRFWSTYGMTETLSHIALRRLDGDAASQWYTPFDSVSVSANADGCLVINAPLVHDGVLVTNDIVEIRPDGSFRVKGRRDNVICSGGIKLQIEEIEEKLRPYIALPFCITKRKDEKFGEVAVLLLACGKKEKAESDVDPALQSMLDNAFLHLSKYERPKHIQCVEAIPMTGTGKIDRAGCMKITS